MSDLQADINWVANITMDNGDDNNRITKVVEAARKYANPDYGAFHKALYEWFHGERPMSPDVERELVDAALGVTEDE